MHVKELIKRVRRKEQIRIIKIIMQQTKPVLPGMATLLARKIIQVPFDEYMEIMKKEKI